MIDKEKTLRQFRKLSVKQRRDLLCAHFGVNQQWLIESDDPAVMHDLAELMIESAFSQFSVPTGLAQGFLVDGESYVVPMATEEPSVIAAASYAASLIKKGGGFETWAADPVMTAQIYLQLPSENISFDYPLLNIRVDQLLRDRIPNIYNRGGGFRGISIATLPDTKTIRFHVDINVCDAMGANIVNTAAETLKPFLEELTGGKAVMGILTNTAPKRMAGASFVIPCSILKRGDLSGQDVAERIVLASRIAIEDPARAATHNKGIMNGITALTLATGNDTRGMEAAAHSYAARDGRYTSLTKFMVEGECLRGELESPFPLGTVGGAIGLHPASRVSLKLLGDPDATQLARIAAAVGLAQNFAALRALVSEGIQEGHMRLHAARVAWLAGARGTEVAKVAAKIWQDNCVTSQAAEDMLTNLRAGKETSND